MQDEINQKAVALSIRSAKLTRRVLEAIRSFKELVKTAVLDRSRVRERSGPEL